MVSSDWPSQIFEKKNWWSEFGPNGPKSGPKLDFLPISQVWFISFSWNRIQWKLKIFRAQIWAKVAKICPKTRFFCHFLKFCALVFLEIADNDSLQWCIPSSRGKTYKFFFGGGTRFGPKSGLKLGFPLFFQVWFIMFPWIEYSDSL